MDIIQTKIIFSLNTNNLINIFHSSVVSHLRYCITSWNRGNKTLVQNFENQCIKVQKHIISTNSERSHLQFIRGLYKLETAKFMHKFHQQHLPIIFKDFPTELLSSFFLYSIERYLSSTSLLKNGITAIH